MPVASHVSLCSDRVRKCAKKNNGVGIFIYVLSFLIEDRYQVDRKDLICIKECGAAGN